MPFPRPITSTAAISRVRRDRVVSGAARWGLLGGLMFVVIWGVVAQQQALGGLFMAGLIGLWMVASVRSVRCHQSLARVQPLLDLRRYDEAEQALAEVLGSFSLYRQPKRSALASLAVLRHAQRQFDQAGTLAWRLLQENTADPEKHRTFALLLGECALELNDYSTAYAALSTVAPTQMPVAQMLKLMELQVDYCVRTGAWAAAVEQLPSKVDLAELLSAGAAARTQALLALAARRTGHDDWADWLTRRAELLADPAELVRQRPILAEVFVNAAEPVGHAEQDVVSVQD